MKHTKFTLCSIALLGMTSQAHSAVISWQSSVDMYQGSTVETFVDTTGTVAVAYNNTTDTTSGNTAVSVNGVAFTPQNTGTALIGSGGESITINGGTDNEGAFGDGDFSSNGSIYHLIRGATYNVTSIDLGGLTVGHTYLIQSFNHDGRSSRHNNFITGYDGSTAGPVGESQLSNYDNALSSGARVGDSIIGTFVADSATQVINIFGSNNGGTSWGAGNSQSQINAVQLRTIAVPEPSSALLALLGLSFGFRRSR